MTILELPGEVFVDQDPVVELAALRQVPDWERLMEEGTTPALVLGGERRARPRQDYAATRSTRKATP
jgi:hypothetical protein